MTNKNKKVIFLTGATGLIGSYLLKLLLKNGYKVYALVRNKQNMTARERIKEVLKFWGNRQLGYYNNNLIILEGDLRKENLGFDTKTLVLLKNTIQEIFHCAASTQFNDKLERLIEVNVNGTRRLLDLSFQWYKFGCLKKINYLSTVYVCGDYSGKFTEYNLDVGQQFNTAYERSKFEAERVVQEYRKRGLWVDIFRPPTVAGETLTGKILTFKQALYQALHILNFGLFNSLPVKNSSSFHMVFLDELCSSIICVSHNTVYKNRNYHPFSSRHIPIRKIINVSCDYLGIKSPRFVTDNIFNKMVTPSQKLLLKYNLGFINTKARIQSGITNEQLNEYKFKFSKNQLHFFENSLRYAQKKGFVKLIKLSKFNNHFS